MAKKRKRRSKRSSRAQVNGAGTLTVGKAPPAAMLDGELGSCQGAPKWLRDAWGLAERKATHG